MTSSSRRTPRRRRALTRLAGVLTALVALPVLGWSLPDGDGKDGSFGSDPTVGTLPMTGGDGSEFDQTLTLRGDVQVLRTALRGATGDGYIEVIDTGDGQAWARFYGDVRIEVAVFALPEIQVGLFSGFQGSGMHYVVGGPRGFAAPRALAAGYELPLDLTRAVSAGLLQQPLYIYARHRSGERTSTALEMGQDGATVVLHQDV